MLREDVTEWPVEREAALDTGGEEGRMEMGSGLCGGGNFEYPASFPGCSDVHSSPHQIWSVQ